MRVCGIHARSKESRYTVGLAVVDSASRTCLKHFMWSAPAGETDAGQLQGLYLRALELMQRTGAEVLVSWTAERGPGGEKRAQLIDASRAEGTVMAAAGAVDTISIVDKASNPAVRAFAGGGSTADAVDTICRGLADVGDDDPVRRAAAAALSWADQH